MRQLLRLFVIVPLSSLLVAAAVAAVVWSGQSLAPVTSVSGAGPSIQLQKLAVPSKVYDSKGNLLGYLSDSQYRAPVPLSKVPPLVVQAVLDVEDNTFFQTGPIDLRGILRALKADVSSGHVVQGGSTITQQLVKKALLTPKRTVSRKLHEAVLAIRLSQQMTKRQILDRYLNTIYFGNGAYGIEAAAKTYFNESVGHLDAAQAALLAAMIENPSYYDPVRHPRAALQRRNIALQEMVRNHDLSQAQATAAEAKPLTKAVHPFTPAPSSAFLAVVLHRLLSDPALGPTAETRFDAVYGGDLRITTTLDPTLQSEAEAAVSHDLPSTGNELTAALVAMDPSNGEVRALVSGNPTSPTGYDVATGLGGTGRQAGSSFKPFTLMAALESGYSPYDLVDGTGPCTFDYPGTQPPVYTASNAEPGYGVMTVLKATADSVNCAYLRLGLQVGLDKVRSMAQRMGVTTPIPRGSPSIVIGSADVTPLEMADAYSVLANGGILHQTRFIEKVVAPGGRVLVSPPGPGKRVVPQNDVRITDKVLQAVVQNGTGTAAALGGREVAGKTGTTDNEVDAWFDGFTPQLVTSVWMGAPKGEISMADVHGVKVYGGTYPAQIWHDFMSAALSNQPVETFPAPDESHLPAPVYISPPYAPGTIPSSKVPVTTTTTTAPPGSTTTTTAPPKSTTTTTAPPASTTTTTAPPASTTTTTTGPPGSSTTTTVPTTPPPGTGQGHGHGHGPPGP
ncbi:MAG: transglycosylase domain-containing protein [Acidimicrobiales bacterium]